MTKLRVYLDTNTIHDYFINRAKFVKYGGDVKIPEKFRFMSSALSEVDFITSFLTKAEIFRELVSAHSVGRPT